MKETHAVANQPSIREQIEACEQAVRSNPRSETAYAQLGLLYKKAKDYKNSVLHYRQALLTSRSSNSIRAEYATEAGICCALLYEYEPALAWWKQAIDLDPTHLNPYLNIAFYHEEQQNLGEAEAYLLKALHQVSLSQNMDAQPDYDTRPDISLARIYSKQDQWDKALIHYKNQIQYETGEAHTLRQNNAWTHCNIATCYLQMGQSVPAMEHFEKAIELDSDSEAGRYAKSILAELSSI